MTGTVGSGASRIRLGAFVIAVVLLTALGMVTTTAEATTVGTLPSAKQITVNAGPGDQADPHVSGDWVSYTSELNGSSEVRYHNLATGTDDAIPSNGGMDFLPDVSGSTVVYTHLTTESDIYAFDLSTPQAAPVALDPHPGSNRREARVGGRTVAWQDFDYTQDVKSPEIDAYDLDTQTVTRLTSDELLDKDPAVSPDGNTIVWTKCQQDSTGCQIWEARNQNGTWTTDALTTGAGKDAQPDTDGQNIVYSSARTENGTTAEDIYWQPVGGGPEQSIGLTGQQPNPNISANISGNLISFEQVDYSTQRPEVDVWVFDLKSQTLYRLMQTPQDEGLNDISVGADGLARVVWTAAEVDENVYALEFQAPQAADDPAKQIDDLIALVKSFDLSRGIEQSLLAKLENVQKQIEASNKEAACGQLGAFDNQVKAQSGKKLTEEQANKLTEATKRLEAAEGCEGPVG